MSAALTILADIGGTHARLAQDSANGPQDSEKFRAADYDDLGAAVADYCAKRDLPHTGRLAIGTAAHPDADGIWHFQNCNKWAIDPAILAAQGWDTPVIVNDFVASSCGAVVGPRDTLTVVRDAPGKGPRSVVLGPGTGLGLGYVENIAGRWHVQETLGGHMFGASLTDEQFMAAKIVRRLRGGETVFIHEDVCSGVGLPRLYEAVCLMNGQPVAHDTAEAVIKNRGDLCTQQALRLFHEFWGLYAHNALVTGHAYGGVYLDGGLTQALAAEGAFDRDTFLHYMTLEPAAVVREHIDATPVYMINDPFVALAGLSVLAKDHA